MRGGDCEPLPRRVWEGSLNSNHQKSPALFNWMSLLSRVSLLSGGSHELAGLLKFYDAPRRDGATMEVNASSVVHFIPTDVMPHVMPISIVVVISGLFILGLDESLFLLRLSQLLLALTSFIFVSVALLSSQIKFDVIPSEVSPDKVFHCACLWTTFFSEMKNTSLFRNLCLYSVLVFILTFLPQVTNSAKSLLLPLGGSIPFYEAVQVPLTACCLCMSLYSLYIPTIQLALRCHQWRCLTKENRLTGTHFNIIVVIGLIASTLVFLYSSSQLLSIASLTGVLKKCADQLVMLFSPYRVENAFLQSHNKPRANYKEVNQLDCSPKREPQPVGDAGRDPLSAVDSPSHSSDETDIDELVEEYRCKTKVLEGSFYNEIPTVFTSRAARFILFGATIVSTGIYIAFLHYNYLLVFVFSVGITFFYFGLRCLPKDRSSKGNDRIHEVILFSYSLHVILFFSTLTAAWTPVLCWTLLGLGLQFSEMFQRQCWPVGKRRESSVNLMMVDPTMCTFLQRVQT